MSMKFCHQCGEQNPDKAKFCGHCGYKFEITQKPQESIQSPEQPRFELQNQNQRQQEQHYKLPEQPVKKKKSSALVYIVLIIGVPLSLCIFVPALFRATQKSGNNDAKPTLAPKIATIASMNPIIPTINPATQPPPKSATTAAILLAKIGQDVRVEDVRWKITEASDLGNILKSDNQFIKDLKTPGRFIKVKFEIENMGKDMKSFMGMDLVDDTEREFKSSSDAFSFIPDEERSVILTNLNPNVPKVVTMIYEVPADAKNIKAKVTNLSFISESTLIDLGLK